MSEKGLNDNQRRFAYEYIQDRNGTQAAIRAGYSEKNARVQAHRLLTNANVLEAIREAEEQKLQQLVITAATVVNKAWESFLINAEVVSKDTVNGEGAVLKSVQEMRDSAAAAKFLEQVAKFTGISVDKQRITEEVVYKWQ